VESLTAGITQLLPSSTGASGAPAGTVFKVERGPAGEKIAYIRMFSGMIRARDVLPGGRKVTAINVFEQGRAVSRSCVSAGQIAKVWGLVDIRIGDSIGIPRGDGPAHFFSPPTLETVVVPVCRGDKGPLRAALGQLAEQDPLINVRQDDVRQEIFVSLYGEVQKEVIQATLAEEYGIDVTFRETTTICIERPVGVGEAVELIGTQENPFLATVGLRVESAAVNSGVEYRRATEVLGTMPPAFFTAIEETVYEVLEQGIHGWRVTDCRVTLTHTGYYPRQSHAHQGFNKAFSSTAGDFRNLTPLVLMAALRVGATAVYEPMNRFTLEIPADLFGPTLPALNKLRAIPEQPTMRGATCIIEGEIPAARVYELQQGLPALSRGEGVLETEFDRYQPVTGVPPTRPRTDHNPLDRKEYLLHVQRRV
jgi:ribosomal protection tetracycline resistance protein